MDEIMYDALVDLKKSVDRNNELQEEVSAAIRALTEMLGHSIDSMKELTEALDSDDEE